jgi:hypothetical protein
MIKVSVIVLLTVVVIALTATLGELVRKGTLPRPSSPHFGESIFPEYLLRWPFIVGTLIPALFLPFFKKKPRSEEYSALDKFLHYLFVGNRGMAKLQFKFECFVHQKCLRSTAPSQNIYVSGLARSGSTALMQYLGQLRDFESLSYRNMPLLFMPRTGSRLISNKKSTEKERSHKDGMTHSLSTYEALEEPFWLHFAGLDFIRATHLFQHNISEEVHAKYQKFRALVGGEKTYLAKNNNHLLRAKSLHQLDAQMGLVTRTIIPFREPVAQAKSLLAQHKIMSKLQSEDDFALDYMDFLVHHEFGLHAKTLVLGEESDKPRPSGDMNTIDYWLQVWNEYYQAAFELCATDSEFCFFCYEDFLRDPRASLSRLRPFIHMTSEQMKPIEFKKWGKKSLDKNINIDNKYSILYKKMVRIAINHEYEL